MQQPATPSTAARLVALAGACLVTTLSLQGLLAEAEPQRSTLLAQSAARQQLQAQVVARADTVAAEALRLAPSAR